MAISVKVIFIIFCIVLLGCGVLIIVNSYTLNMGLRGWLWYLTGVSLGVILIIGMLVWQKLIKWTDKLK